MESSRSLFSSYSNDSFGNGTFGVCIDDACSNLSPPILIPPIPSNRSDPDPTPIHIHHANRLLFYFLIAAASLLALSFILLVFSYCLLRLRRSRRRRRLLHSNSLNQNPDHPPPFPFQDPDHLDEDGDNGTHHIWYIRTVGLDDSVIKSIAATVYRSGDAAIGSGDCTVCLGEFVDGEVIKLLPKCSHAFHQSCIDTWLRSHVNCPLCRAPVVVAVGPPSERENSVSGAAVDAYNEGAAPVAAGDEGEECVVAVDPEVGSSSSSNSRREGAENENESELQPIRRSVSMDSSSLGVLMLRVHLTEEEEKKKEGEVQGGAVCKNGGKGSESLRKWGMEMKRSLSSRSGRMFFTRNARARARGRSSSVLPL